MGHPFVSYTRNLLHAIKPHTILYFMLYNSIAKVTLIKKSREFGTRYLTPATKVRYKLNCYLNPDEATVKPLESQYQKINYISVMNFK